MSDSSSAHRTSFEFRIARQALLEWIGSPSPMDRVLNETLREHKVGALQRGKISDAVFRMVRYWPMMVDLPPQAENAGWMRKMEESLLKAFSFSPADLQKLHERTKPTFNSNSLQHFRHVHGIPEFFLPSLMKAASSWHEYLHQMLEAEAPLTIRVNTLKTTAADFAVKYECRGAVASKWVPDAFQFPERWAIHQDPGFLAGEFEVQDEHSQLVAWAARPQPGESVLDLCAGAGGKTLHLGAMMQNKGEIVAYDVSQRKTQDLLARARRAGLTNVRVADPVLLKKKFDLVVVDAPCSGLGTLRRSPDRIFRFQEAEARRLVTLQWEILLKAISHLKPGGRLLYATCSVRPEENSGVFKRLLAEPGVKPGKLREALGQSLNKKADEFLTLASQTPAARIDPDLSLESCLQLGPSSQTSGGLVGDGFFMSLVNWEA